MKNEQKIKNKYDIEKGILERKWAFLIEMGLDLKNISCPPPQYLKPTCGPDGDTTVADLASLVNTNSQRELYNHKDDAATPGSVDETGFEETETIVSVVTTTPENNLQGQDQYNGDEQPAAKFDKEVFLEEVRKYRCL